MASNIGNLSHGILFTLQVPHRQRLAESNQPTPWFTSAEIAPSGRLDFFFFFGRDLSRLRRIYSWFRPAVGAHWNHQKRPRTTPVPRQIADFWRCLPGTIWPFL